MKILMLLNLKNTQALRVINSTCAIIRGNCDGSSKKTHKIEAENTPPSKTKIKKEVFKYSLLLYL